MLYELVLVVASVAAGTIAAVSGFGIGSLLTPVFGWRMDMKLAVAVVSVPHLVATGLRLWLMRKHVDRKLLLSFGLMSAAGGLLGALLHLYVAGKTLAVLFGGLLIFTGLMGLTGRAERLRFHDWAAWLAGAVSGLLGGMVGNQGGIRSAAMLGLDVARHAFVATATAVGLIVDLARMPVYLMLYGREVLAQWPILALSTAGAVVGTFIGLRYLSWIPERLYKRLVAGLILALGAFMLWRALA
ncbi:MAG TPA: sulfite exporter TauE/SafE family protein [Pirellulales bacterium]